MALYMEYFCIDPTFMGEEEILMKVRDIAKIVSAKVLVGEDKLDYNIRAACGSDLMSDVLAYVNGRDLVLLTGLANTGHTHSRSD